MISVIIPTFSPQEYILDCISSVCNQDFDEDKFEVLIVLNGPYTPYYDYIQSLNVNRKKFKLYYSEKEGVSQARNIGLDYALGEFVCFIDDDDIVSSNYLSSMYGVVKKDAIVVSNVYSFINFVGEKKIDYLTFGKKRKGIIRNRQFLSNSCSKLIPIHVIRNKRFDVMFTKGEDSLFMFSISCLINEIIQANEDCIYYRRLRFNSASRKKSSYMESFFNILRHQIKYTSIYLTNPFKYNFILYVTRLVAVIKNFWP